MIDEIITVECEHCGSVNQVNWSEADIIYFQMGDLGVPFKCWKCGNCYLKFQYYPRLTPIPNF